MVRSAVLFSWWRSRRPSRQTTAPAPATLTVTGDVATPLTLKAGRSAKHAARNSLGPRFRTEPRSSIEGVLLREILKRAGAPLGKQLRGKALAELRPGESARWVPGGVHAGGLDAEFGNAQILIADKRDGKPLFGYQGPFRLVCPDDKAGARSVRMLETLEVVRLAK